MLRAPLLLALLLITTAPAARASYFLPAIHSRHYVLAGDWTIKGERIFVRHADGKKVWKFSFRIDLFWLADRINSDSICTGSHEAAMRAYIGDVARKRVKKKKPRLFLELINVKRGQKLFVAGLWPRVGDRMFLRMKAGGTPQLLPYADAIKLKSRKQVDALLKKKSDAGWKALLKK